MHDIEPFYNWQHLYIAAEDENSPFYGTEYSEFTFSNTVYNYYIHPQWDNMGSETLYLKIIFVDYDEGFAFIELIGEWNDTINNDIMLLKEFKSSSLDYYFNSGGELNDFEWRKFSPGQAFGSIEKIINKRLQ